MQCPTSDTTSQSFPAPFPALPSLPSSSSTPPQRLSHGWCATTSGVRHPLGESTGNTQAHIPGGRTLCQPNPLPFAASAVPQFVVPSQALELTGRPGQLPRDNGTIRRDRNPLYTWSKGFRDYRARQEQKETTDEKKWPNAMEDAFLDGILIIPNNMGRRKFSIKGTPNGRNMLIGEYIHLVTKNSLPPGIKPERKVVSSHIQVVKSHFKNCRCVHFFFPSSDETKRFMLQEESSRDDDDIDSFKNSPVLAALAEGRLPDVKPNYAHFHRLLSLDTLVAVRPKTCWIYVSSSEVRRDEASRTFDHNGLPLDPRFYPHLEKNRFPDEMMMQVLGDNMLLHEYTRQLEQQDAGPAREVMRRWQDRLPALHKLVDLPQRDEECPVFEMMVTLELSKLIHFPAGSDLNGFIEMSIQQPGLETHSWRCVTHLIRPPELGSGSSSDVELLSESSEVGTQFTHQSGCSDDNEKCDCMNQPRKDVRLPFLAANWAFILSNCARFQDLPPRLPGTLAVQPHNKSREEYERKRAESGQRGGASPSANEQLAQVAMLQELWSAEGRSEDNREWVKRAIVLWRFQTVQQRNEKQKMEPVVVPARTIWRYLTVLDPASQEHQSQMYLPITTTPAPAQAPEFPMTSLAHSSRNMYRISREAAVHSSSPHSPHPLTLPTTGDLRPSWGAATTHSVPHLPAAIAVPPSLSYFPHGMAMPPPTASLSCSYPMMAAAFLGPPTTRPLLDESGCDPSLQSWHADADLQAYHPWDSITCWPGTSDNAAVPDSEQGWDAQGWTAAGLTDTIYGPVDLVEMEVVTTSRKRGRLDSHDSHDRGLPAPRLARDHHHPFPTLGHQGAPTGIMNADADADAEADFDVYAEVAIGAGAGADPNDAEIDLGSDTEDRPGPGTVV